MYERLHYRIDERQLEMQPISRVMPKRSPALERRRTLSLKCRVEGIYSPTHTHKTSPCSKIKHSLYYPRRKKISLAQAFSQVRIDTKSNIDFSVGSRHTGRCSKVPF